MGIEIVERKPKEEVGKVKDVFLSGVKVGQVREVCKTATPGVGSGYAVTLRLGEDCDGYYFGQGVGKTPEEAVRDGVSESRKSAERVLAKAKWLESLLEEADGEH